MKTSWIFLFLLLSATIFNDALAQTQKRGQIITPASTNIMDPNGDGFVSKTTAGFSTDGDYLGEFELPMFGIPKVNEGEVDGDNNAGQPCGITDLIPDKDGYSVYALRDASNNLIVRFRVGNNNPSVEAWTILLDTDGLFGPGIDPNATTDNPGFELDITLIKRSNAGVFAYNIDGVDKCGTPLLNFELSKYFQISVADEVSCGDPDYFYDFYVPFTQVAAAYNASSNAPDIDINTGLRYVAVTNTSATCAMDGKIADVSGLDNDDPQYSSCITCAFTDIINSQCPTAVNDLCDTCEGFSTGIPSKPTINEPIRAGQQVITGTSGPGTYLVLSIFQRTGGTDVAPIWSTTARESKTVLVPASGIWSVTLSAPLLAYDQIVAKAQLTSDGSGCDSANGNTTSTSVTVVEPNVAPVAQDQAVAVIEDTPKVITLVATDADGDAVTYTIVTPPAHGVLTGTGPNVTYTPAANYTGPDSFTFSASDGILTSNTATVTITVQPVNDAPVANNQNVTVVEDGSVVITFTGSDVDGDAITFVLVTQPTQGTLTGSGATYTYTPNPNYFGADSFTFKTNDGTLDSNIATVSITVTAVNDLPVAGNLNLTTPEDTPIAFVLPGSDAEASPLTYIIVTPPANGTLTGTGANRTYSPNLNFNGTDSFTYQVNDGNGNSNIATVTIEVTPVNEAPVALDQSLSTPEETPLAILLTATNVDGDALTFTVVTPPQFGVLSGTGANLTYTPNANFTGQDSFTFKANDGTFDSNIATIVIDVTPISDAPVASDISVTTEEDTSVGITLIGSDPDGDAITYIIVSGPTNGTLTGTGANIIYIPNTAYFGPDSFTYKVNDGTSDSNIATVTITVTPRNDAPIPDAQVVTVIEDTPTAITLTGSDIDGDPITFEITELPTHGTFTGTAPNLIYTPDANYVGTDIFRFRVSDGSAVSAQVYVVINVVPVNDAPVADDQVVSTPEETPVVIILSGSDVDVDELTYTVVTPPAHGTLTGSGAALTYTPDANYTGPDSFTFTANDGTVDSNVATVTITVTPVNDAPVALNKIVTYDLNTPVNFTLDAVDVDGDPLTYTIITTPADGVLTGTAPNLTYTPNTGFNLTNTMTFKVSDGTVESNVATVTFVFNNNADDAPTAENQTVIVIEDIAKDIVLGGTDPDPGDVLTFTIVDQPQHGTLTGTGANLVYTPDANYFGPDSFTYKVTDATNLESNVATVSITVTPVNDPPIAFDQSIITEESELIDIILTGFDVDGDPLTFTIVTPPQFGIITGTPPNLKYIAYTTGIDSFTFKVSDGTSESNIATILINVLEDNDPPFANSRTVVTIEDRSVSFTITGLDDHGDPITYIIVTLPAHGTLTGTAPNLTYTPDPDYFGPDSFTFKVNDGVFDSNIATVSITVTPVDDVPVANNQTVFVIEDTPEPITLTAVEVDGDVLTYTILTGPANGVLSGTGPNLIYTPNPGYTGPDSFTFRVNDGITDSNIGVVTINVIPANDPPVAVDNLNLVTDEDVALTFSITLNDTDSDGIINTATVDLDPSTPAEDKTFTVPGEGTYTVDNAGNVTYTPFLNFNGVTTPVQYTVKDNRGDLSNTASIVITVNPVNDAPVVQNTTITINEDETVSICLTVTDLENDPAVFTGGVSLGGNGIVVLDPATGALCFLYTPKKDYNGQDIVEVTVCDANNSGLCSTGLITINITPVNDPPTGLFNGVPGNTLSLTTPEDTPLNFCFDVTDPEGNTITVGDIKEVSGGGTLVATPGGVNQLCFTFTPAPDFNGVAIWEINACDDGSPSACGKITIEVEVTPVSDPPVAQDQVVTVLEDTPTEITLVAVDPDAGDVFTFTIVTPPSHGTLTGTGATVTYTPDLNYIGPDSFTFKANDGTFDSNAATVSITVVPVNDAPIITAIPVLTVPEDSVLLVCLGVTDIDSDNVIINPPTNVSGGGTMTPSTEFGFCFDFRPAKDFNGESFWKFTVCDDENPAACTEVTVQITVTPVNDPPIAVNDFVDARSFEKTAAVNILANDLDIENDDLILTVTPVAGPFHGTVTMNPDGSFQYQSNLGYVGSDSVRYQVCDNGVPSLCDEGVVFIEVGPAPFKIYNGFSPNGDGLNDYWRIDGIEAFPNNRIRVFDRYNNMIFETTGYNNDENSWKGQANHSLISGNLPEGTYFYSVDLGDGSDLLSGYIVLKKN